jgi:hypothetical protein
MAGDGEGNVSHSDNDACRQCGNPYAGTEDGCDACDA